MTKYTLILKNSNLFNSIFNRFTLIKIVLIFTVGLSSRYIVNTYFNINVSIQFLDAISILYFSWFAGFVVTTNIITNILKAAYSPFITETLQCQPTDINKSIDKFKNVNSRTPIDIRDNKLPRLHPRSHSHSQTSKGSTLYTPSTIYRNNDITSVVRKPVILNDNSIYDTNTGHKTLKRKIGNTSLLDKYMVDIETNIPKVKDNISKRINDVNENLDSIKSRKPSRSNYNKYNEYNRSIVMGEASVRYNKEKLRIIQKSEIIKQEQEALTKSLPKSFKEKLSIQDKTYKKDMDYREVLKNQNESIKRAKKYISNYDNNQRAINPQTPVSDVSFDLERRSTGDILLTPRKKNIDIRNSINKNNVDSPDTITKFKSVTSERRNLILNSLKNKNITPQTAIDKINDNIDLTLKSNKNLSLRYKFDGHKTKNNVSGLFVNLYNDSRRKFQWVLWDKNNSDYRTYEEFKRNWNPKSKVLKSIYSDIKVNIHEDISRILKSDSRFINSNDLKPITKKSNITSSNHIIQSSKLRGNKFNK